MIVAGVWLVLAALTAWIALLRFDERSGLGNLLTVALVGLMVLTAFLLIRWDSTGRE